MMKEIVGTPIWEQIHKRIGQEVMGDSGIQAVAMIQALMGMMYQKGVINEDDMLSYREKYDNHMRLSVDVGTYSLLRSPNMRAHVPQDFLPSIYEHLIESLKKMNIWGPGKDVEKAEKEAQTILGENWRETNSISENNA